MIKTDQAYSRGPSAKSSCRGVIDEVIKATFCVAGPPVEGHRRRVRALQEPRERHLPEEDFAVLASRGEVFPPVDAVPAVPGLAARGGPVHEQRLPDLLHEEEDPDRVGRAGQGLAEVRQSGLVNWMSEKVGYIFIVLKKKEFSRLLLHFDENFEANKPYDFCDSTFNAYRFCYP